MRTSRPDACLPAIFATLALLASASACDVYDSSLLTGGAGEGASGGNGASTSTGASGGGGAAACESPADCGVDSECGTFTCADGACAVDPTAAGTVTAAQTAEDCIRNQCDGQGNIVGEPDDADLPVDDNDCTNDRCDDGIPDNPPRPVGSVCGAANDQVCNAAAACVECIDGGDCPISGICTDTFECAPVSCDNGTIDGEETDTDCGGGDCPGCGLGLDCEVGSDCLSMTCSGGLVCVPPAPTCMDTIQNQGETDVDCGGPSCDPCQFGEGCVLGTDCETGTCSGALTCTCAPNNGVLLISEIRTRGPGAGNDDFVELYNPGSSDVTLTSAWVVESRSDMAGSYSVRFTGAGQVVPSHEHFLLGGSAYVGPPAADAPLNSGISDEGSLVLKNGSVVIDAVCFTCGADTFVGYTCEGGFAMKTGCTNSVDKSIERKPGAAQGNCVDTQDNSQDFAEITPSIPQSLASAPVP